MISGPVRQHLVLAKKTEALLTVFLDEVQLDQKQ